MQHIYAQTYSDTPLMYTSLFMSSMFCKYSKIDI